MVGPLVSLKLGYAIVNMILVVKFMVLTSFPSDSMSLIVLLTRGDGGGHVNDAWVQCVYDSNESKQARRAGF